MKRKKTAIPIPEQPKSATPRSYYRYYALRHPLNDFDYPFIGCDKPVRVCNYAWRTYVEDGRFQAWGEIDYPSPLDEGQLEAFGLAPSCNNPDMQRKIKHQTQAVGRLESGMPGAKRMTWWDYESDSFLLREFITPEQLEARLEKLSEAANP